MRIRSLAAVVATLVAVLPFATARAQIQQTWTSSGSKYRLVGPIADLNHDGVVDLLARENPGSSTGALSVRSAATGAIEAQTTVTTYVPVNLDIRDLDADGKDEIIFMDGDPASLVCLPFSGPPGPMVARWSLSPFHGYFLPFYADLDGNGHKYVVFWEQALNGNFDFYTNQGALFSHYTPNAPFGWVIDGIEIRDLDGDGREEILLIYRDPDGLVPQQHLIMLESTAPVGVEMHPADLRPVALGAALPNPTAADAHIEYVVPARGQVTLRLYDVAGRKLRVLVDGIVEAGSHLATWDGRDDEGRLLPAGTYFYELSAGGTTRSRRIVRLQ